MGFQTTCKGFGAHDPPKYNDQKQSIPVQQQPFTSTFACLILARRDRIRICGFPPEIIPPINEAIRRVWVPGVQREGSEQGGYEWKLSGNPWSGQMGEAVPARRLVIHVLHALACVGWEFHAASDLSKKVLDKDTLFFRLGVPRQRYFFAISFNEYDKVRLIDSPNLETLQAFQAAVATWPGGIQDSKEKEPNCFQIKLRGNPWFTSDGGQINQSRMMACNILSAMDRQGFDLIGTVDMSVGHGDNSSDLDTWFFASK